MAMTVYIKHNSLLAHATSFRYNVKNALGVCQYLYWYFYLKTNSNYLRIASVSSNRSVEAITSADSMERATRRGVHDVVRLV